MREAKRCFNGDSFQQRDRNWSHLVVHVHVVSLQIIFYFLGLQIRLDTVVYLAYYLRESLPKISVLASNGWTGCDQELLIIFRP